VHVCRTNFIMIQETMCNGEKEIELFQSWLKDWSLDLLIWWVSLEGFFHPGALSSGLSHPPRFLLEFFSMCQIVFSTIPSE
jgi:hypothetical protein